MNMETTTGPVTSKYGQEVRTYFTGSFLNRLSFLRHDYEFLDSAVKHPGSRFLPLNGLNPVLDNNNRLVYLPSDKVQALIPNYFDRSEQEQIDQWVSTRDATGVNKTLLVFLGVDEADDCGFSYKDKYQGRPYFAIDTTPLRQESPLHKAIARVNATLGEYVNIRANGVTLQDEDAPVYAQARMYMDWNKRNKFCGGCGHRLMTVNGGCKLVCPEYDNGVAQPECETRGRVTNLSFPRTDCVIIVAVVDYEGQRLLLGNNKRYPSAKLYSCLAGFLEPAESIEECCRREVYEESGVVVGNVRVHSTQPWPYPSNIMIGCVAQVASTKTEHHEIHLEHDPELNDAQWVPFDEVRSALARGHDTMHLPPKQAIAHVLLDDVVNNKFASSSSKS